MTNIVTAGITYGEEMVQSKWLTQNTDYHVIKTSHALLQLPPFLSPSQIRFIDVKICVINLNNMCSFNSFKCCF